MDNFLHAVKVKGLTKRFTDFTALKNVEFNVEKGDSIVILGPNGAGKSTLLKTIAGLYKPTRGAVEIFGKASQDLDTKSRRKISFLGEYYALYDNLTSRENIRFFSKLYNVYDVDRKIYTLLKEMSALEYIDRKVGELSRGTKQKIAICRALINEPELLLLDEPAAFLDADTSERIHKKLKGLSDNGVTILYATQRLEELYKIGNKLMIIDKGRIIRFGEIGSVINRLNKIQVEITVARGLKSKELKLLGRYNARPISENMLIATVRSINSIPGLLSEVSRAGGLIINVNSLNQNISDIIKKSGRHGL